MSQIDKVLKQLIIERIQEIEDYDFLDFILKLLIAEG